MKLFMEGYFDLVLCSLLQIIVISNSETKEEFDSFFNTFNDKFVVALTLFYSLALLIFPVFGWYKIIRNYELLEDPDFNGQYEYLISDLVLSERSSTYYHMLFVTSRIIISFVLIFMRNLPQF